MAVALLSHEVCDLTLGKPLLCGLPSSSSVRDALLSLKQRPDLSEISVWSCPAIADIPHSSPILPHPAHATCRCIGKICMLRLLCYLASENSLRNLSAALDAPVTVLLEEELPSRRVVQCLDPEASLQEVLEAIADGAENLIIPIGSASKKNLSSISQKHFSTKKKNATSNAGKALLSRSHNGLEYCWLTHEDVMRFLLGYIAEFSPLPMMSISELGIITTDILTVGVDEEASDALEIIKQAIACHSFTAVAAVSTAEDGAVKLVGEISSTTLATCDETAALALATLSVGEFISYAQGCQRSSMDFIQSMCVRLCKKLELASQARGKGLREPASKIRDHKQILHDLEIWADDADASSASDNDDDDDDDDESEPESPTAPHELSSKWRFSHSNPRMGYPPKCRSGPICCRPTSSLVAVIMQALAHRESYVWVTNPDDSLVGIVTFAGMLGVFLNQIKGSY